MARDDNGDIYSVRYEAVNAMLLNEFLKEHRKKKEGIFAKRNWKLQMRNRQKELIALKLTIETQAGRNINGV